MADPASAAASAASSSEATVAAVQAQTAHVEAITAANAAQSAVITIHGFSINIVLLAIGLIFLGILYMFYKIQASNKLDFADMLTKDGRSVSLTKVLQLLGGITATWVVIKLATTGTLSESIFGIYLTYVGAIEGYSKYVAAKYGYTEMSVKDGGSPTDPSSDSPQKTIEAAVESATDAEASARDAKVAAKNAAIDLKSQDNQQ
jgi:hypothetical protein